MGSVERMTAEQELRCYTDAKFASRVETVGRALVRHVVLPPPGPNRIEDGSDTLLAYGAVVVEALEKAELLDDQAG